jgi:creatinine amidohydrolase/Fe(II)-dependent formamide hydrolase-like protein
VNGHGGNTEALHSATELLRNEGRPVSSWSPRIQGADAHAGHTETSLLLHLHPERVNGAHVEAGIDSPISELEDDLRTAGVAAVSPSGVLGDPTTATATAGSEMFGQLTDSLVAAAHQVISADRRLP